MAGERADRMTFLAARAGARIARIQQVINDKYSPPSPLSISKDEVLQEMQNMGHMYDEHCNSPFCVKYRQMFAQAALQVAQMSQQPQQAPQR